MKPWSSASSASEAPAASAAALTASTSSRDDTLKQYSASVCVVGSAIGSFANSANFSRLSSMTKACSPTSMQAAVSSVNIGLKLNPSFSKNALLRPRSATGMFTNSMRPGCAGLVMLGLQSGLDGVHRGRPARPAELIGGSRLGRDGLLAAVRDARLAQALQHRRRGADRLAVERSADAPARDG